MPTLNTLVLLTSTTCQQKFKGNVLLPFDGNNGHANAPECALPFSLSWSTFHIFHPYFHTPINYVMPIPVAARSKACVCGRLLSGITGSNAVGGIKKSVSCECSVLSGRSPCVGLITRPEEPYRVWCVQWVWSWSSVTDGHDFESGRRATGNT